MTRFSHRLSTAAEVAVAAPRFWYAAALAAHTGWGIYPVLGRYLQTVAGLPSMSVLVLGGIPMTVMLFAYVLPRYGWRIYAVPMLWSFGAVTVMRSARAEIWRSIRSKWPLVCRWATSMRQSRGAA